MKRKARILIVALLAVPLAVCAQSGSAKIRSQFVGTWRLLSYVRQDVSTGATSNVMGDHPSGYISYGADGRMMVIIVGTGRKRPAGNVATPAEAEALLHSMLAYAGKYEIDAVRKTVTHRVDVSWDETRTGESHVRKYVLEGDRLILTTEPSLDPANGHKTVRTLLWERVK